MLTRGPRDTHKVSKISLLKMCFIYARICENDPLGKTPTQAFIGSGTEVITFWPGALFRIVILFLETYEQTYEVKISLIWPFCGSKHLVWKWRCAFHKVDWSQSGPFCTFNAHLRIMSCPQHLYYEYYKYLYYRSHSHSCKVTKFELWSKTVHYRLHLPSCFRCLLLSLFVCGDDIFCFFHILHRRMCAWNVWEVTLFHIKIITVCEWYDGMNCMEKW